MSAILLSIPLHHVSRCFGCTPINSNAHVLLLIFFIFFLNVWYMYFYVHFTEEHYLLKVINHMNWFYFQNKKPLSLWWDHFGLYHPHNAWHPWMWKWSCIEICVCTTQLRRWYSPHEESRLHTDRCTTCQFSHTGNALESEVGLL
jgi:hypothetical protein